MHFTYNQYTCGDNVTSHDFLFSKVNLCSSHQFLENLLIFFVLLLMSVGDRENLFFVNEFVFYTTNTYFFKKKEREYSIIVLSSFCVVQKSFIGSLNYLNFMIKYAIALICLLQINHVISKRQIPIGR